MHAAVLNHERQKVGKAFIIAGDDLYHAIKCCAEVKPLAKMTFATPTSSHDVVQFQIHSVTACWHCVSASSFRVEGATSMY